MLYNNLPESKIIEFINRLLSFKIKNKFQQIVLAFIVHNIKEDQEVRDIQKLFRIFNQNNDGLLNKEEFYIGLCKYKDENEINDIIDGLFLMLDSSNSGYIQFEQFLRATLSKEKILSEKNLLYAFNFIDKQGIGKLTVDSIKNSFGENENISSAVFENIFKEVNHKKENEISFDEFKDMMFDN
jgi:calcium-dependent protein kinase